MAKMNRLVFAAVAAVLAGTLFAVPVASITPEPQSKDPNSWWQKRFAEKQELVKKGGSEVVFIGDSITHGLEGSEVWKTKLAVAPYNALNLGFSGDRTEHVLWRLDHGELDGYKAKVIVLLIGTNNTGHRSRADETPVDTIIAGQDHPPSDLPARGEAHGRAPRPQRGRQQLHPPAGGRADDLPLRLQRPPC